MGTATRIISSYRWHPVHDSKPAPSETIFEIPDIRKLGVKNVVKYFEIISENVKGLKTKFSFRNVES